MLLCSYFWLRAVWFGWFWWFGIICVRFVVTLTWSRRGLVIWYSTLRFGFSIYADGGFAVGGIATDLVGFAVGYLYWLCTYDFGLFNCCLVFLVLLLLFVLGSGS